MPVLAVALVVLATSFDLPLHARFAQARPAFEQAIAERGGFGEGAQCPDRIGSFQIERCETQRSNTYFIVPGGFLGEVGFVYLPEGVPSVSDGFLEYAYEPLSGPWYTFSTD